MYKNLFFSEKLLQSVLDSKNEVVGYVCKYFGYVGLLALKTSERNCTAEKTEMNRD